MVATPLAGVGNLKISIPRNQMANINLNERGNLSMNSIINTYEGSTVDGLEMKKEILLELLDFPINLGNSENADKISISTLRIDFDTFSGTYLYLRNNTAKNAAMKGRLNSIFQEVYNKCNQKGVVIISKLGMAAIEEYKSVGGKRYRVKTRSYRGKRKYKTRKHRK
jgi:hypothetical protein